MQHNIIVFKVWSQTLNVWMFPENNVGLAENRISEHQNLADQNIRFVQVGN